MPIRRLSVIVLLAMGAAVALVPFGATANPAGSSAIRLAAEVASAGSATPAATASPKTPFPRHHVVLIVIDGARAADLQLSGLPHIQSLMNRGVVYDQAFVGQMESVTPAVHITLGTGTLPKENGFMGWSWEVPGTNRWVNFWTLMASHAVDPVLKHLPVRSVAARLHRNFRHAVSIAAAGHKDYAMIGLGGGAADYELYGKHQGQFFKPLFLHTPPPLSRSDWRSLTVGTKLPKTAEDSWTFNYALKVAARTKPRLLMMNLGEADTWGHWFGPGTSVLKRVMRNIDRGVGRLQALYQRLGILKNTDFVITADHAMMRSRPARSWYWVSDGKSIHIRVARAEPDGGAIWLANPLRSKEFAEHLVAARPGHVQAIFYRSGAGSDQHYVQASPDAWLANQHVGTALQHLVDTAAGRNGPDVWVLYSENYTVFPSNVSGRWKGTHGGATWKVQHIPLVISGPDIRAGVHSSFPARSIDIAPTLERLLGLPAIKRDGVVLADALRDSQKPETGAQNDRAGWLTSDVQALQLQSAAAP